MILLLAACAADIRDLDGDGIPDVALTDTSAPPEDTGDTEPADAADTGFDPHVIVTEAGDGSFLVEVDSTDGVTYMDLGVPAQTSAADGWELSFERYFFRLNGGSNGDSGVEAAVISDQAFDAVTAAPTTGWLTDSEDLLVLGDWYVYDSVNHVLYAADQVYAIRNASGENWKLQFVDYYDDYGNTGFPSFRVAPLPSP